MGNHSKRAQPVHPRSLTRAQRLRRLLCGLAAILAAGLAYAAFVTATGWFLPCPFRAVTGLLCPGCGVSHLCLALLRLDPAGAWSANAGLLLMLPVLALLLIRLARRYVVSGSSALQKWESVLVWAMVAWLMGWSVFRNLV